MSRTILCLLLAVVLLGCNGNKKRDDAANAKSASGAKRAPDSFEAAPEDPPLTAHTRFAAGQLAEAQGDFERAMQQYREAVKLDPKHQQTLFRMGALYTKAKRFNEAIDIWQQYIKATNHAPAAYNNLAFCYEQAGRLNEAEETYKRGIERDPQAAICRVNYGLMLARHDRTDDAIAQLRVALSPAEVHYNLGSVCEQMGRRDAAKAYYEKALELDPKLSDARSRLAALK
jgi:tetratricopeptide (TPR) repeat protein